MRGNLPEFNLRSPASESEALLLLKSGYQPFAGGTDIMVQIEAGVDISKNFVDVSRLASLQGITSDDSSVSIGAMVTYSAIRKNPEIKSRFPNLIAASELTGSIAIQNRGTIGGNIANASPAGDSLPVLLAYDAELQLLSAEGVRRIHYSQFHRGYKATQLRNGEIIQRVILPLRNDCSFHYFRKVGTRSAQAISKVVIAATSSKIAVGSVGPTPILLTKTAPLVFGDRSKKDSLDDIRVSLQSEISPLTDIRSTAEFRSRVTLNLINEIIMKLKSATQ